CGRLFAGGASPMGLAAPLFRGRASGAIGSLCAISSKGINSLEKHSSRELGSIDAVNWFALETICFPAAVIDCDEFRLAWHTGYVSDVFGAILGLQFFSAFDGNRHFDDWRDYRRNSFRSFVGSDRAS